MLWTQYNLIGAILGAAFAFIIARYLAYYWVTAKAGGRVKLLINGVEGEGWRFVAPCRALLASFAVVPYWSQDFKQQLDARAMGDFVGAQDGEVLAILVQE